MDGAHYAGVRGGLWTTIGVSLGAHVVIAAALLHHRGASAKTEPLDPTPAMGGETFELPAPDTDVALANATPSPETDGTEVPSADGDAPAKPTPKMKGKPTKLASRAGRPSGGKTESGHGETGGESSAPPALYGAVGDRSAADVSLAFTRAFPQAASADPLWRTAALGSAGEIDIVLTLDDAGHLEGTQVLGAPTPALSSAVRRTLALIKGRAFIAKGKTTKLHLVATVSADAVHDGLHGDVFAVGASPGSAFFALAIGRRIDVVVKSR